MVSWTTALSTPKNELSFLTPNFIFIYIRFFLNIVYFLRQWPRGLRHGSAAARLLGFWVRIPPGACIFASCDCCVLSVRGLCVGLITCPEKSYRVWCVWVWSQSPVCGAMIYNRVEAPKGGNILLLICPMLALAAKIFSAFEI
jgi:hypothetical protein